MQVPGEEGYFTVGTVDNVMCLGLISTETILPRVPLGTCTWTKTSPTVCHQLPHGVLQGTAPPRSSKCDRDMAPSGYLAKGALTSVEAANFPNVAWVA
uniref:Putative nuclear distribution protein nudc n=1 Tax=Ixodes ricinus TaxID=34613 RepID=A0A0K8R739_IXORI